MADTFRRHNVASLDALIPHFHDEVQVLSATTAAREELEELFARDRAQFEEDKRGGWH
jgi:glutathione-regulated potassium-efflux system ancillary protein KefC